MHRTWAEIRHHPTRLVAALLAVVLSVGFLSACLVFVATQTRTVGDELTARTSRADLVVTGDGRPAGRDAQAVAQTSGVAAVAPLYQDVVSFTGPNGPGQLRLDSLPSPVFRWTRLTQGHYPNHAGEVVLGSAGATAYGLRVGSVITPREAGVGASAPLRVTGLVAEADALLGEAAATGLVAESWFAAQQPVPAADYLVRVGAPTPPEAVAAALQSRLGADVQVSTAAQVRERAIAQMTNGIDVFRYLLVGFGGVALLVGSMIIANTFTVIVAQRRRQLGLLRALGASTGQVRRGLLGEAVVVGIAGSGLGAGAGVGMAALGLLALGQPAGGLVVPPGQVGAAALAGLLITGVAALVPARRATRVAPLEALRLGDAIGIEPRRHRIRLVLGMGLGVVGTVGVVVALRLDTNSLVATAGASAVLALAVLVLAGSFLPAALGGLRRLLRRAPLIVALAAANTVRNPARTAATGTALMLAVGLVVTLQVGAGSVRTTSVARIGAEYPVDLTVTDPHRALDPGLAVALAAVPGVAAVQPVPMIDAVVGTERGRTFPVAGLGPEVGTVVTSGLAVLDDHTVLVEPLAADVLQVRPGQALELSYGGRRASFTVTVSKVTDSTMVAISADALNRLAPNAATRGLWAAVADDADPVGVYAAVSRVVVADPSAVVAGALPESSQATRLLDALLNAAVALLAVAVVIAVVGVGNTLGLSVVERARESALVRALGLQRRQLKAVLTLEAVLLALVAAAVGVVAGVVFGWVGVAALAKETGLGPLHLTVPTGALLAASAAICGAAVLASVLPGRRAARAEPVAALAGQP